MQLSVSCAKKQPSLKVSKPKLFGFWIFIEKQKLEGDPTVYGLKDMNIEIQDAQLEYNLNNKQCWVFKFNIYRLLYVLRLSG